MSEQHPNGKEPESKEQGYSTRAVHAGLDASLNGTYSTNVPIYATTTFLTGDAESLDEVLGGTRPGYVYGRYGNPTVTALETAVSALEGAAVTIAFSSGMAALHAALLLCELEPGDVVLAGTDLYGASHTILATIFAPFNVQARFVDVTDLQAVEEALRQQPAPRVLLFETISNPLIKVADLPAICALAKAAGTIVIADSTFTPPPLLQPLAHGADIAVNSATKYIGGHGDVMGGLVSLPTTDRGDALRQISKLAGGILGPFEAFLIGRGLRTLTLRVRQQCENAAALANWLSKRPGVRKVHYPGLADHPQHALAEKLLKRPYWGGMLAFEIEGAEYKDILAFFNALKLVLPATTLGDIYTEVSYPLMSSHREWSPAQLRRSGITPGLVRVSAGIEDIEDLIADFDQALTAIGAGERRTVAAGEGKG